MATFDESKVIDGLHPEKAEVGKKYWGKDTITGLKESVEKEVKPGKLITIGQRSEYYPFMVGGVSYALLYPYEEPDGQGMTNRQLAEWVAKGNGEYSYQSDCGRWYSEYSYSTNERNEYVEDDLIIRTWDSEEWIKPTYEIYLRDCKGITQEE